MDHLTRHTRVELIAWLREREERQTDRRAGGRSTRRGAIDAAADVLPDAAAGSIRYAVGYVNEITLNAATDRINGVTLVVNKGTVPLKLSTALMTAQA